MEEKWSNRPILSENSEFSVFKFVYIFGIHFSSLKFLNLEYNGPCACYCLLEGVFVLYMQRSELNFNGLTQNFVEGKTCHVIDSDPGHGLWKVSHLEFQAQTVELLFLFRPTQLAG